MKPTTACLLLGVCHIGSAAAIGLGEASVRSYLGQPLHATVSVIGATPELTAGCFRITSPDGGVGAPLRTALSLERTADRAVLHIRTPQAMNDPIAQFIVVAECEARIQREYVVLLDPPAMIAPPAVAQASADPPKPDAGQAPHTPGTAPSPRATPPAEARPVPPARVRPAPPRPQPAGGPRLVLSGKHNRTPESERALSLRLDASLPDPAAPAPESLTATELSDENTALSRKLAHLEAQLAALRQRNAELEAQQRVATAPPAQPARPQWPLYLLAIGLLGSGAALVAWMRRRTQTTPDTVLPDTLAWAPAASTQASNDVSTERMPASDLSTQAAPVRMADVPLPPAPQDGTEVKEDILDQAEVFMAHGHGDLAVHLLQEHLREAPTESPVPWLLLLDLLHRAGDTAGYAAASTECRRYFNVNLSGHPISQDGLEPGPGLEAYPHLLEKLVHVWNTPEIGAFFADLIYDKRGGTRMGFEPGAYRDILLLRDIAQQTLPLAA